jgi:GDPmannose 4,6-dehydratase
VGDVIIRVDEAYFRPAEVETLLGDASLAREDLGWVPECTVEELANDMIDHDMAEAKKMALIAGL